MKKCDDFTINDFKAWAARQAGFDFQPYPTFTKTIYNTGDYAMFEGSVYKSLTDTNISEPTDADAWEDQTPVWVAGTYNLGAIVYYSGSLYECVVDATVDEPGNSTQWKLLQPTDIATKFDDVKEWAQPIAYATGDRVIAQDANTFKFYVYESTMDDNYADPSTTTDKEESDDGDISGVILDSEIEEAMTEAKFKFNRGLFPDPKECKTAFCLLVAFFIAYDRQMSASGINGGYKGLASGKRIGEMSITYMADPALASGSQLYAFFARNPYGMKYYNLIKPRLKAMSITIGRTTSV